MLSLRLKNYRPLVKRNIDVGGGRVTLYSNNQVDFLSACFPRRIGDRGGTFTGEVLHKLETYFSSTNSSRNERVKANLSGGHRSSRLKVVPGQFC